MKRLFLLGLAGILLVATGCVSVTMQREAESAFRAGDYQLAAEKYETLAADKNCGWKTRIRLGYSYIKAEQYDKALAALSKIKENQYTTPWKMFYTGLAHLKNGQRQEAIAAWNRYKDRVRDGLNKQVASEIKRQLTLLHIEECQAMAQKAVAQEQHLQTAAIAPNSIAVTNYKAISPDKDLDPLQRALGAMLITDLSKVPELTVIERLQIQPLLKEMALAQSGIVDETTAPRAGKLLGAEKLIIGTIGSGSVEIVTNIASTTQGKQVHEFPIRFAKQEFFSAQKSILFNALDAMGINLTPALKSQLGQYYTKNFTAAIQYGKGLKALDEGDFDAAEDHFGASAQADPQFSLAAEAVQSCPNPAATTSSLGIAPEVLAEMEDAQGMPEAGSQCGN